MKDFFIRYKKPLLLFIVGLLSIAIFLLLWRRTIKITTPNNAVAKKQQTNNITQKKLSAAPTYEYKAKTFNLAGRIPGLSTKQIEEHEELYKGYVKQRNNITQTLRTIDRSNLNRTWSPFRELKVEETYAVNGQLLHELYFENMGNNSSKVGAQTRELIEKNFGSFDAFKKDFIECAQVSRGWVITAYGIDDGKLHNFVLEAHNQNVPILAMPLLVLDVYEHAYMIDYGINRTPYIEVFWNTINWQAVENRITKWVNKIK